MPANGSQSFTASLDRTTKIISAVVFVVLGFAALAAQSVAVAVLAAAVIALSYAYSPRGYEITERSIIVRRLIGTVRIPLDDIRELRAATRDDFRGCIRLWGNGGFFGYYGLFRTAKLGKCTWYVTNRAHAVVLITAAKTVVLSPDDVQGFLAAIRSTAPVPTMTGGALNGAIEPRGAGFGWVGAAIAAVALCVVGFAFWYAPGPPKLSLTADALAIHDRFYPVTLHADDVDVAHVRVVDLRVDKDWRPVARTNGFANSHYRAGWFRAANGQKIRLYEAGGRRLVLLPAAGGGTAVLVEAPEPDRFVEEVQREWSTHSKEARIP